MLQPPCLPAWHLTSDMLQPSCLPAWHLSSEDPTASTAWVAVSVEAGVRLGPGWGEAGCRGTPLHTKLAACSPRSCPSVQPAPPPPAALPLLPTSSCPPVHPGPIFAGVHHAAVHHTLHYATATRGPRAAGLGNPAVRVPGATGERGGVGWGDRVCEGAGVHMCM